MSAGARRHGVVDELDGISAARVLGQRLIIEIERARVVIHHHVLEHGAKAAGGREDLRLGFRRQPDHLGVATALEVEHAAVAPAVLVVANQLALGVARQRRLARARQAEEQRGVAGGADVGRAVHGQHAAKRQQVVQDREDCLLVLAGVAGAANQHFAGGEVDRHRHVRAGAVPGRIGLERRRHEHRELRFKGGQVPGGRDDEEVAHEQALPRQFLDEADRQAVLGIRAGVEILHEEFLVLQVRDDVAAQRVEVGGLDRPVDLAPPDIALARGFLDHELVVGRTAGVRASAAHEGAVRGDVAFLAANRVLIQRGRRQVEVDRLRGMNPVRIQAAPRLCITHVNMTPNLDRCLPVASKR